MVVKAFEVLDGRVGGGGGLRYAVIGVALLLLLLIGNPLTVIPAGDVGVKDFFGNVSPNILPAGVHFVLPFTKVVKMSIKTQEVKETAEVPSKEGLSMDLEGSLLFRLDPAKAPELYRTIGRDYASIAVIRNAGAGNRCRPGCHPAPTDSTSPWSTATWRRTSACSRSCMWAY